MKKIDISKSFLHRLLRISGVAGVLICWATMYFFDDWSSIWFWLLISISVVLGYGGAWGGLSIQWGLLPFTNDPLGWRKAKKTYEEDAKPSDKE